MKVSLSSSEGAENRCCAAEHLEEKSVLDSFYQPAELAGACEQQGMFPLREQEIYTIPRLSKKALVKVFIS